MMRFWFSLFLLVICFSVYPAVAQNPDDVRAVVQEHLRTVLGRDFVLLSFSFEGTTWADGSLGCARAGQIAVPGQVPGYRWSFLLDDGINYAVHTDLTGAQIVICSETSTPEITYSSFNGQYFNIEHPNLWSAQRTSDMLVNFAFRGQSACNLPGMQIEVYPDYQTAVNNLGMTEIGRLSLADLGLNQLNGTTISYNLACESFEQTWRASALEAANGTGFIVRQWSLSAIFPIWDKAFRAMLVSLTPGEVKPASAPVSPVNPTPIPETVLLPAPPPAPLVDMETVPLVHVFVQDIYVGRVNALPGDFLTTDVTIPRERLRYAPATGQLAYVENETQLFTLSIPNLTLGTLVTEQLSALPPAWSPDGTRLAYAIAQDEDSLQLKVREADGTDQELGELPFESNCAEEPLAYGVDQLYEQETSLTLIWLAEDRFIYSPTCDDIGLAIWNATDGTSTPLGTDLHRAQLSRDGSKVAAIGENGITIIDLATQAETTLPTTYPPDQIGWDVTGTQLYYSTLIPQETTTYNNPEFEQKAVDFLGQFPYESRQNTVRIFQVDTNNRAEVQRWEGTGFAVGQIEAMPDGSGILFSWIPSDRAMLTQFLEGQPLTIIRNQLPETQLYYLAADGGAGQLLAVSGQPLFAR